MLYATAGSRRRLLVALWMPIALMSLIGCAGPNESATTVLASMPDEAKSSAVQTQDPMGPITLPYRGPGKSGNAYRIVLDIDGERTTKASNEARARPKRVEALHLELHYRENATKGSGARDDTYLISLDALHHTTIQRNPELMREIEVGDDRIRVMSGKEESLSLRGKESEGDLSVRKLLGRVFAAITHDGNGNSRTVSRRGTPGAKQFLAGLLVLRAIGYSRVPLPSGEISPGSVWHAPRYPASRSGDLGLPIDIEYTLAGFQVLSGVPCAWILLRGRIDETDVPSTLGLSFERVVATVKGEAWVELATSRLRRLVIDDEIRAEFDRAGASGGSTRQGVRHATRLQVDLRDPSEHASNWTDNKPRFGKR